MIPFGNGQNYNMTNFIMIISFVISFDISSIKSFNVEEIPVHASIKFDDGSAIACPIIALENYRVPKKELYEMLDADRIILRTNAEEFQCGYIVNISKCNFYKNAGDTDWKEAIIKTYK